MRASTLFCALPLTNDSQKKSHMCVFLSGMQWGGIMGGDEQEKKNKSLLKDQHSYGEMKKAFTSTHM